ncbi:hypothetical protein AX17_004256 [Amanita inopinata Kibby_2008]|nr:hypothetical protein AX17_004256 [Amanita inopinata Kibby_2008]
MLSASARPVALDAQPTKTPARNKARVENAARHAIPSTINPKGKLAHRSTTRPIIRPLGDKTPFPNRINNAAQETALKSDLQRLPKLLESLYPSLSNQEQTPELSRRPSSTRKNARAPRSTNRNFETPINNGNPWDVSDGSIELGGAQTLEQPEHDTEAGDLDDLEYMPPNTLDLPYQPPFDFELPNYKQVGKTLFDLAHSYPFDDAPPPECEPDLSDFMLSWDLLPPLPEAGTWSDDPDDPFYRDKRVVVENKMASSTSRKAAIRPTRNASVIRSSRTATAAKNSVSLPTTASTATTRTGISRPATSTAISRPVTRSMSKQGQRAEVRRPASASATMTPSSTSHQPVSTAKTSKVKVSLTTKAGKVTGGSNARGKGTNLSGPGALQKIKEEQGESLLILEQNGGLEDLNNFLFEV